MKTTPTPSSKGEKKIPCKHDAIFGAVGAKYQLCLICKQKVLNKGWKHDFKIIKSL